MAKWHPPRQWDVWQCELRPGIGREQTGLHDVVVLSKDAIRDAKDRGVAVVAPFTTSVREFPWILRAEPAETHLEQTSWLELDQLQTLAASPQRFKIYRGRMEAELRQKVVIGLDLVFETPSLDTWD